MVAGSTPSMPATVRDGLPSVVVTFSTLPVWIWSDSSVYVTVRPMRPIAFVDVSEAAIFSLAAARLETCSRVEKDAIWPMNSLSFIGFIGSWCWSCATNSFRKSSLPSSPLLASFGFISAGVRILVSVLIVLMSGGRGSGEHVDEQPSRQLDRGADGGSGLGVVGVRRGAGGIGSAAGRASGAGAGAAGSAGSLAAAGTACAAGAFGSAGTAGAVAGAGLGGAGAGFGSAGAAGRVVAGGAAGAGSPGAGAAGAAGTIGCGAAIA